MKFRHLWQTNKKAKFLFFNLALTKSLLFAESGNSVYFGGTFAEEKRRVYLGSSNKNNTMLINLKIHVLTINNSNYIELLL